MINEELARQIARELPFEPTPEQYDALARIALFLLAGDERAAFVLRGYAGTGKTTLVSSLVRAMHRLSLKVILLAPTGRAAKVFSHHSGYPAYTIHKAIYRQRTFRGEDTSFTLDYNRHRDTLFIVDESSMISNAGSVASLFGSGCLLDDLIRYVFEGAGCRLLFVGDTAQLPPVGEEESPALSTQVLAGYGLRVREMNLLQVVRQAHDSGILWNATSLRRLLQDGHASFAFAALPKLRAAGFPDVRLLPGSELVEELETCYNNEGLDETIVITRSNKRANAYNDGIRATSFGREDELNSGDFIMVVKNNYYWLEKLAAGMTREEVQKLPTEFIANGDIAEVMRIRRHYELYGFRFADVTLRFPDYEDMELSVRLLLDTLHSEAPALTRPESERLFRSVLDDYQDIPGKKERMKRLREDPFYNALQVKYAYAITCHKAQGGQWKKVFLDQGWLPPGPQDAGYVRWLYTAVTRATKTLYLVNWPSAQTGGEDSVR